MAELTKDERSLILYLETCVVDRSGRVNAVHMNEDDFKLARKWADKGLIGFGRIVMQDHNQDGGNWVTFTDAAWKMAHAERKAKGIRCAAARVFSTTREASSEVPKDHPASSLTSGCQ